MKILKYFFLAVLYLTIVTVTFASSAGEEEHKKKQSSKAAKGIATKALKGGLKGFKEKGNIKGMVEGATTSVSKEAVTGLVKKQGEKLVPKAKKAAGQAGKSLKKKKK